MLRKRLLRIVQDILPLGVVAFVCCIVSNLPAHAVAQTEQTLPRLSEIYPNALNQTDVEFVELYNAGAQDIIMDNYSLRIKGGSRSMVLSGTLAAGAYKSFVAPADSNFLLVNTGATIQLVQKYTDQAELIVEEVTYSDSANSSFKTKSWSYFTEGWELTPITKGAPNIHFPTEEPEPVDICPATPAIEKVIPVGYQIDENGICVPVIVAQEHCNIEISEISAQPNDNGKEYIEFYNASTENALLEQCKVRINDGVEKVVGSTALAPQAHSLMAFASGAIRNSAGVITLINSDNIESEYSYQETNDGEVVNFESGKYIGVISNHPTPNASNIESDIVPEQSTVTSELPDSPSACPEGKYRNPDTNRCKNIETASSELTPCASDQIRSSETNRCKKINTAAGSSLTPCQPDQVRNTSTNRCKKISSTGASLTPCQPDQIRNPTTNRCKKAGAEDGSLKPCAENQERNPDTNRCRKVATDVDGTVLGAAASPASTANSSYKLPAAVASVTALFGYAAYEYRSDIGRRIASIREKRRILRPPD